MVLNDPSHTVLKFVCADGQCSRTGSVNQIKFQDQTVGSFLVNFQFLSCFSLKFFEFGHDFRITQDISSFRTNLPFEIELYL